MQEPGMSLANMPVVVVRTCHQATIMHQEDRQVLPKDRQRNPASQKTLVMQKVYDFKCQLGTHDRKALKDFETMIATTTVQSKYSCRRWAEVMGGKHQDASKWN